MHHTLSINDIDSPRTMTYFCYYLWEVRNGKFTATRHEMAIYYVVKLRVCNDILNTILRCYVINWFHRIRYTTTVFSADAIVGNAVSAALSQKTLSNYELYLASNLKFHVSLANFKKNKRVFTRLTKAAGEISSAKYQGSSALLSKTFIMPPAAAPFSLLATSVFPLYALFLILSIRTARAAVLCERE